MFVREKRIGAYRYLYLVETVREDGKFDNPCPGTRGALPNVQLELGVEPRRQAPRRCPSVPRRAARAPESRRTQKTRSLNQAPSVSSSLGFHPHVIRTHSVSLQRLRHSPDARPEPS